MTLFRDLRRRLPVDESQYSTRSWWDSVALHQDPMGAMIAWRRRATRYELLCGLDGITHAPRLAEPDSAVLVLGSAGSAKTSSIMAPNAMLAPGSLLCVSNRADIYRTTARVRARVGRVLHFSPTGQTVPGAEAIRYSPLQGCEDSSYAQKVGLRWASWIDRSEYALQSGAHSYPHFRNRCASLLYALFFIAATDGHDLSWVYDFIISPGIAKSVVMLRRELEDHPAGEAMVKASQELDFLSSISQEERGSILTTTANALGAYRDPKVVEHSRNPNLDFDAFVRGEPDKQLTDVGGVGDPSFLSIGIAPFLKGSYDSLYITEASAEDPSAYVQMDVEFRMREAMYRYALERELAGQSRPMPLTIVNDEGSISPPVRLVEFVSAMRDRSVLLVMALQSLSQARNVFGRIGEDFLTLFPTTVVFRGTKDIPTLEALSKLSGQFWQKITSTSRAKGAQGLSSTESISHQLVPRLPIDQIAAGHPTWRNGVLVLNRAAQFLWVDAVPYWAGPPWLQLLVNSAEHSIGNESKLPLPELAKEGDYSRLSRHGLEHRYRDLQIQFQQF